MRISDGRMSGATFGTIVLHVTPNRPWESRWPSEEWRPHHAIGGAPQAALRVGDEELARRAREQPVAVPGERDYRKLFLTTVNQADQGVDFDFLRCTTERGTIPGRREWSAQAVNSDKMASLSQPPM